MCRTKFASFKVTAELTATIDLLGEKKGTAPSIVTQCNFITSTQLEVLVCCCRCTATYIFGGNAGTVAMREYLELVARYSMQKYDTTQV